MQTLYFNLAGNAVRLLVDEEALPERCEMFDPATGSFIERGDLEPDVWASGDAKPISAESFWQLVEKLRKGTLTRR